MLRDHVYLLDRESIATLRQAEAGVNVAEIVRTRRIGEATLYSWKVRYDGLDVSQVRRLRELEKRMHG